MQFIQVNSSGYVLDNEGQPLKDISAATKIIQSISLDSDFLYINDHGEIAEVYDFLYVIQSIIRKETHILKTKAQYDISVELDLNQSYLDFKDRFIIYNTQGIPCVLSDRAQEQLFDMADSYTDESLIFDNKTYDTPLWLGANSTISKDSFWSERYKENQTGWDLNGPTPVLISALTKLKLPKMRVAVLGCGAGHDAYHFSSLGHKTVGFDFSEEAIQRAKILYPENDNLSWVRQDIFNIPDSYWGQFDLVFDHTLFCAVDPLARDALVKIWHKLLSNQGYLLGVFFTMPKPSGPPYGATEAEIESRIGSLFRKDYWLRARTSVPKRLGKELLVLATKK